MRSGKPWIKKVLLIAVIIAIVGAGVNWVAGMDRSNYKQAFDQAKQNAEQYISGSGEKVSVGPKDHHEREMSEGGQHHHEWDAGMAVGGTILAAGLLYWTIKRRKRSSRNTAANATTPVIPSTSDFLDQWENNQINTKESN